MRQCTMHVYVLWCWDQDPLVVVGPAWADSGGVSSASGGSLMSRTLAFFFLFFLSTHGVPPAGQQRRVAPNVQPKEPTW